jgi:hypothetical protein
MGYWTFHPRLTESTSFSTNGDRYFGQTPERSPKGRNFGLLVVRANAGVAESRGYGPSTSQFGSEESEIPPKGVLFLPQGVKSLIKSQMPDKHLGIY